MPKPKGPPLWAVDIAKKLSRGMTRAQRKMTPPAAMLLEVVSSGWRSEALWVIAELGVADALASGPMPVSDLAKTLDVSEDGLYRVMRALAHDGIFSRPSARRFGLAPLSEPLRSDHPQSMRQTVRMFWDSQNRRVWSGLIDAVRTGKPQFEAKHDGLDMWTWFATKAPENGQRFHDSMLELTRMVMPLLLAAHDWGQYRDVLDLGGGQGTLMAGILKAFPELKKAGVMDLPEALEKAPAVLKEAGVSDRCELVEGNAFESVPGGWHAYVMKNILHGLQDAALFAMLDRIRKQMSRGDHFLVIEMLVPESPQGTHPSHLDLQMLVSSGGRERSASEYRQLFGKHGFELVEVARTASPFAVLVTEAR